MNQKIMGLNVGKTLKGLFSFNLKKRYLLALLCLMGTSGSLFASSLMEQAQKEQKQKIQAGSVNLLFLDGSSSWHNANLYLKDRQVDLGSLKNLVRPSLPKYLETENGQNDVSRYTAEKIMQFNQAFLTSLENAITDNQELKDLVAAAKVVSEKQAKILAATNTISQAAKSAKFTLDADACTIAVANTGTATLVEAKKEVHKWAKKLANQQEDLAKELRKQEDSLLKAGHEISTEAFSEDAHVLSKGLVEYALEQRKKDMKAVLGLDKNPLTGNTKVAADAVLFDPSIDWTNNATLQTTLLAAIKDGSLNEFLKAFTGVDQYNGVGQVELRNHTMLADSVLNSIREGESQFWFTPLGFLYSQKERENLAAFDAQTGGVSVGLIRGNKTLSAGVHGAYLYSKIDFTDEKGDAKLHTFHFGPVARFGNENFFVKVLVEGSKGFYKGARQLTTKQEDGTSVINEIERKNGSWNVLASLSTGGKIYLSREHGLTLLPIGTLNWLNSWEEKFEEKSGSDVNPSFRSYWNPKAIVKLMKDFNLETCRITPSVHAGWVAYMPLKEGEYAVRHKGITYGKDADVPTHNYQTFTGNVHQLVVGGAAEITTATNFAMTLNYEAQLGKGAPIHTGLVKFDWKW